MARPFSIESVRADDLYEAVYAYEAADVSDLSFDVGEYVRVLKRDGDWWTGQIGDRTGTFPYNYVQKLEQQSPEVAIAVTPYQTTEAGHLSFEQNEIIHVTKKVDENWYEGEIRVSDR